jgi:hypothetical protein
MFVIASEAMQCNAERQMLRQLPLIARAAEAASR